MANKKQNSDIDIPIIFIILGFILFAPLGIILAVLKVILSSKTEKNTSASASKSKTAKKKKRASRRSSSIIITKIFGFILLAFSALLTMGVFISPDSMAEALHGFIFGVGPFLVSSVALLVTSGVIERRESRFARIRAIIGDRDSINLDKLAGASGTSVKKVCKDIQKMIDNGDFGKSAYIDLGKNNFMRTPYAQPDASPLQDGAEDATNRDKKRIRKSDDSAENSAGENSEFERIIEDIRRLNDEIKDLAVSYRIESIETHTRNIFDYVTDHPEAMSQIRTFMNYYLPTTLKLLESYSRIERVGIAGENMKKSKESIENILDLLVVGFEQQVDQLFQNESIDISSDIKVLETMMQKDGLSGKSDFDIKSYSDGFTDEISDEPCGTGAAAAPQDK